MGEPMATASTSQDVTQLTISVDTLNALKEMADRQGISPSEALQQAISVSHLLVDEVSDQDTHILLKKGNQVRELTLLPGNRG